VCPAYFNPSLAFHPPAELSLPVTVEHLLTRSKALFNWLLWAFFPYSTCRIGSPLTRACRLCPFRFQGLITLLAACFSQNLWPFFQGQALMGFPLQRFVLPQKLLSSRRCCSLDVDRKDLPSCKTWGPFSSTPELWSLGEAALAKDSV